MPSLMAQKTAEKYRGRIAETYEAQRAGQVKWEAEHRIVKEILAALPAGTTLLDIPVGTGRFLRLYDELGISAVGMDVSADMMSRAPRRTKTPLRAGNIFAIDLPDKSVDVALSIRIMNLMDADDMVKALRELQRVARSKIVFNLRAWVPNSKYRRPQKIETVERALQPGWSIAVNRPIHQDDFRMFMLCAG